mmetsp:Transcript_22770/g.50554  ORF Transcript_22770/g.50554 Transcript_22770/m.50554 type:complete len:204 (-) Transcript_22770:287-898(-)
MSPAGSAPDLPAVEGGNDRVHLLDLDALQRRRVARPARPRGKLGLAGKEGGVAPGANVRPDVVLGGKGVEDRRLLPLRPPLSEDVVLGPAQQVRPFPLGVLDGIAFRPAFLVGGPCGGRLDGPEGGGGGRGSGGFPGRNRRRRGGRGGHRAGDVLFQEASSVLPVDGSCPGAACGCLALAAGVVACVAVRSAESDPVVVRLRP